MPFASDALVERAQIPPQVEDVVAARRRVASHLRLTPVMSLKVPTPHGLRSVVAKLELLQRTGCFKVRGALAALSATDAPRVVACSGGNHGLGVAEAAQVLGKEAVLFLPSDASPLKVAAMKARSAEVRMPGPSMDLAFRSAEAFAETEGLPLIHPFDQAEVVAGQGTLGMELLEQAPHVRRWLVAVGGGGLAAGMALALRGQAEVVPVEPALCPTLHQAQVAGGPTTVKVSGSARTSLGAPRLGALPWGILRHRVGPVLRVTEDAIAAARRWLWDEVRLLAEPGGATALAALMSGVCVLPDTAPLGLVICGGNADGLPE
ncbi:MAG: pyridoxal-phosphate dependent enzyme [Acidobacteria bacterium]|nr:pyridoxal-phosphate dependent enzyme [Acidobacteriota bacterium]